MYKNKKRTFYLHIKSIRSDSILETATRFPAISKYSFQVFCFKILNTNTSNHKQINMDIPTVIESLFFAMDIDSIPEHRARLICQRVSALTYQPLEKWIIINTMDMAGLKRLIYEFKSQNLSQSTQAPSQEIYEKMKPSEIWTESKQLRLQNY